MQELGTYDVAEREDAPNGGAGGGSEMNSQVHVGAYFSPRSAYVAAPLRAGLAAVLRYPLEGEVGWERIVDPQGMFWRLHQGFTVQGVRPGRVAVALPPGHFLVRAHVLPALAEADMRGYLLSQHRAMSLVPMREPEFRVLPLAQEKDRVRAVLVALERDTLLAYLDLWEALGFTVERVEHPLSALARAVPALRGGEGGSSGVKAVVVAGAERVLLALYEGGIPVLVRDLPAASSEEEEEALVEEILRTLARLERFYQGAWGPEWGVGGTVDLVVLFGGEDVRASFLETVGDRLAQEYGPRALALPKVSFERAVLEGLTGARELTAALASAQGGERA
ncbi:MAG: hypothetical protein KM296_08155 [Brockia lithotrophica]|nr:hypothetical protein [Brockia lithotrophica]